MPRKKKENTEVALVEAQVALDREDSEIRKQFPDPGQLPGILNLKLIGELAPATAREQRVIVDQQDGVELMREYGYSLHPGTKRSRVITVLMALESEAMTGNISAAREFLDRTAGKVMEVVAIGHGKFGGMSDRELIDMVVKKPVTKKK